MWLMFLNFANQSSLFASLDNKLSLIGKIFHFFYGLLNDSVSTTGPEALPASCEIGNG
jgi:hypothetical protein